MADIGSDNPAADEAATELQSESQKYLLSDEDEEVLEYEESMDTGEDLVDVGLGLELHPENDLDLQPDLPPLSSPHDAAEAERAAASVHHSPSPEHGGDVDDDTDGEIPDSDVETEPAKPATPPDASSAASSTQRQQQQGVSPPGRRSGAGASAESNVNGGKARELRTPTERRSPAEQKSSSSHRDRDRDRDGESRSRRKVETTGRARRHDEPSAVDALRGQQRQHRSSRHDEPAAAAAGSHHKLDSRRSLGHALRQRDSHGGHGSPVRDSQRQLKPGRNVVIVPSETAGPGRNLERDRALLNLAESRELTERNGRSSSSHGHNHNQQQQQALHSSAQSQQRSSRAHPSRSPSPSPVARSSVSHSSRETERGHSRRSEHLDPGRRHEVAGGRSAAVKPSPAASSRSSQVQTHRSSAAAGSAGTPSKRSVETSSFRTSDPHSATSGHHADGHSSHHSAGSGRHGDGRSSHLPASSGRHGDGHSNASGRQPDGHSGRHEHDRHHAHPRHTDAHSRRSSSSSSSSSGVEPSSKHADCSIGSGSSSADRRRVVDSSSSRNTVAHSSRDAGHGERAAAASRGDRSPSKKSAGHFSPLSHRSQDPADAAGLSPRRKRPRSRSPVAKRSSGTESTTASAEQPTGSARKRAREAAPTSRPTAAERSTSQAMQPSEKESAAMSSKDSLSRQSRSSPASSKQQRQESPATSSVESTRASVEAGDIPASGNNTPCVSNVKASGEASPPPPPPPPPATPISAEDLRSQRPAPRSVKVARAVRDRDSLPPPPPPPNPPPKRKKRVTGATVGSASPGGLVAQATADQPGPESSQQPASGEPSLASKRVAEEGSADDGLPPPPPPPPPPPQHTVCDVGGEEVVNYEPVSSAQAAGDASPDVSGERRTAPADRPGDDDGGLDRSTVAEEDVEVPEEELQRNRDLADFEASGGESDSDSGSGSDSDGAGSDGSFFSEDDLDLLERGKESSSSEDEGAYRFNSPLRVDSDSRDRPSAYDDDNDERRHPATPRHHHHHHHQQQQQQEHGHRERSRSPRSTEREKERERRHAERERSLERRRLVLAESRLGGGGGGGERAMEHGHRRRRRTASPPEHPRRRHRDNNGGRAPTGAASPFPGADHGPPLERRRTGRGHQIMERLYDRFGGQLDDYLNRSRAMLMMRRRTPRERARVVSRLWSDRGSRVQLLDELTHLQTLDQRGILRPNSRHRPAGAPPCGRRGRRSLNRPRLDDERRPGGGHRSGRRADSFGRPPPPRSRDRRDARYAQERRVREANARVAQASFRREPFGRSRRDVPPPSPGASVRTVRRVQLTANVGARGGQDADGRHYRGGGGSPPRSRHRDAPLSSYDRRR